jgi:hypothetical protein
MCQSRLPKLLAGVTSDLAGCLASSTSPRTAPSLIPYVPNAILIDYVSVKAGDAICEVYDKYTDGTLTGGCLLGHGGGNSALFLATSKHISKYRLSHVYQVYPTPTRYTQ